MALSAEHHFLRRTSVRRYETEPSLRLLSLCERSLTAESSGVAMVEFCNQGLQSVAEKEELYTKSRRLGTYNSKKTDKANTYHQIYFQTGFAVHMAEN